MAEVVPRISRTTSRWRMLLDPEGTTTAERRHWGSMTAPADDSAIEVARQSAEAAFSRPTYTYIPVAEPYEKDPMARVRQRLAIIDEELSSITEAEFRSSLAGESLPPSPRPEPLEHLKEMLKGILGGPKKDKVKKSLQQQLAAVAVAEPEAPPAPSPSPPPPPAPPAHHHHHQQADAAAARPRELKRGNRPEGTGHEIMLQGFNWESWKHHGGWFQHMAGQAQELAAMGFTTVWLPPFTDSVSEQGYMPRDLYNLNSRYGSEGDLIHCVRTLQARGIKVLGDAVLNHRCATHQGDGGIWNRFGGKLAWDNRAIVGDQAEYGGRGNLSSGEFFGAAPNIDHSQDFVKRDLSEWLVWLRQHVGFDGWRLDFVKGFHGSHVKDYLEASCPEFVVGEYWDSLAYGFDGTPAHNQDAHRQRTVNWIEAAGGLATAFDITTKGILHAAFERCEYWRLSDAAGKPPGLMGWWPSRAVTFLENHDTGSTQGHWCFPHHALEQGYAYLLTHPGTPTVFYDHLHDNSAPNLRHAITRLIQLRTRNGINCRSTVKIVCAQRDVYAAEIDDKVVVQLGPGDFVLEGAVEEAHRYQPVDAGHCWTVWEKKH
ncbi:alpha amylase domain [Micractinium conductrix]|uniref:Alpha-amylase n=1 Tax=Micractinium conductrix TaxID=554055 RepID=A0A2P6V7M4_9CHLO|nr:alpha amylase domain [Micractinium conductrix]|eukprot:PSC70086.1 alpha amylase domain [Micractinium conductrix]